MADKKIEFIVPNYGESYPRDAVELTHKHVLPNRIAENVADFFHSNCDGWEASWPIVFEIYVDGKLDGRYSVEREAEPTFYAKKLEG